MHLIVKFSINSQNSKTSLEILIKILVEDNND